MGKKHYEVRRPYYYHPYLHDNDANNVVSVSVMKPDKLGSHEYHQRSNEQQNRTNGNGISRRMIAKHSALFIWRIGSDRDFRVVWKARARDELDAGGRCRVSHQPVDTRNALARFGGANVLPVWPNGSRRFCVRVVIFAYRPHRRGKTSECVQRMCLRVCVGVCVFHARASLVSVA